MFMVSGEPNLGKTSLAKTALSLCSHPDFLYAFNSSKEFIASLAQKTSGLIVVGKFSSGAAILLENCVTLNSNLCFLIDEYQESC